MLIPAGLILQEALAFVPYGTALVRVRVRAHRPLRGCSALRPPAVSRVPQVPYLTPSQLPAVKNQTKAPSPQQYWQPNTKTEQQKPALALALQWQMALRGGSGPLSHATHGSRQELQEGIVEHLRLHLWARGARCSSQPFEQLAGAPAFDHELYTEFKRAGAAHIFSVFQVSRFFDLPWQALIQGHATSNTSHSSMVQTTISALIRTMMVHSSMLDFWLCIISRKNLVLS